MLETLHVVSVVLGLIGALCVAIGWRFLGQLVWIPANGIWILWCLEHDDIWGCYLFIAYLAFACLGVLSWLSPRQQLKRRLVEKLLRDAAQYQTRSPAVKALLGGTTYARKR